MAAHGWILTYVWLCPWHMSQNWYYLTVSSLKHHINMTLILSVIWVLFWLWHLRVVWVTLTWMLESKPWFWFQTNITKDVTHEFKFKIQAITHELSESFKFKKSAVRQAHIPFLSPSWVLHWGIPKSNADPEKGTKTGCRQRLGWPQKVPSSVLVLVRNMIDIFWHDYTCKGCSFGCQQNELKKRFRSFSYKLWWDDVSPTQRLLFGPQSEFGKLLMPEKTASGYSHELQANPLDA